MIKIYVTKQSNYPVSALKLKEKLKNFLLQKGIKSDALVEISLVGEAQMNELAREHNLDGGEIHNVFSFPASELRGEFVYPPDDIIRLGEIVICYPKVFEVAKSEGIKIDDKVYELVEHGAKHLLGEHHDI